MTNIRIEEWASDNSTLAIGGVLCSADSLVKKENFVLPCLPAGKSPTAESAKTFAAIK